MRSLQAAGLGFVLLLPLSVEIPASRDSAGQGGETHLTVVGGIGRYGLIERGCEGQVIRSDRHDFADLGAEARHVFRSGLALETRGGRVHERAEQRVQVRDPLTYSYRDSTFAREWTNAYVNPSIGFEGDGVGFGVGVFIAEDALDATVGNDHRNDPTFHLRLGSLDAISLQIRYMETLPLYSGGGVAESASTWTDCRTGTRVWSGAIRMMGSGSR